MGMLVPVSGQTGVYLVDLGPMAAGASATVAVLVIPESAGPINVSVAASDALTGSSDPTPTNNFAYAGSWPPRPLRRRRQRPRRPARSPSPSVTAATSSVVQINLSGAVTRAEAVTASNYLVTDTSAAGVSTTIAVRSSDLQRDPRIA